MHYILKPLLSESQADDKQPFWCGTITLDMLSLFLPDLPLPPMPSSPPSTLGDRIRRAREAKRMSQDELGHELGVSGSAVGQWEADKTAPRRDRLLALAKVLDVSYIHLTIGDSHTEGGGIIARRSTDALPGRRLPIYSWEQITKMTGTTGRPTQPLTGEYARVDTDAGPAAFLLRVRDDVMFDERTGEGAPPGALLTVDPEARAEPGRWVLALSRSTPVVGRLVVAVGRQFLEPLNKRYPSLEIDEQVVLLGVCTDLILQRRLP